MTIALPNYPGNNGPIEVKDDHFSFGTNDRDITFPVMTDGVPVIIDRVTADGKTFAIDHVFLLTKHMQPRFKAGSLRLF